MNVLTDEEKGAIARSAGITDADDGAMVTLLFALVEAAVIRKLVAGVSMEPECWYLSSNGDTIPHQHIEQCRKDSGTWKPLYTAAAIAAARVQENERCLALMDAIGCDWRDAGDMAKFYATNYLREAIRALLGKEST